MRVRFIVYVAIPIRKLCRIPGHMEENFERFCPASVPIPLFDPALVMQELAVNATRAVL